MREGRGGNHTGSASDLCILFATHNGCIDVASAKDEVKFAERSAGMSSKAIDVGLARLLVTVFWSLIPIVSVPLCISNFP